MQIKGNLHQVRIDFTIPISPDKQLPRFVNVLIYFGEKITLIDSGVKGSQVRIFDYITSMGRSIHEIGALILSHSHPDHIGSAAAIREITGCRILAHEMERRWFESIEQQVNERPVPGFRSLADQPVPIDEFIADGQLIDLSDGSLVKVLHSPGHSPGSVNLLFEDLKVFFTADSIPLKGDIPNYDDAQQLCHSLEKIEKIKGYDILLTSWTPPLSEPIDIKNLISEGKSWIDSIDRVVKSCYKGEETASLSFCQSALKELGLPPFLTNPLVDKTFRSHLSPSQGK